jgi:hypothetical protein
MTSGVNTSNEFENFLNFIKNPTLYLENNPSFESKSKFKELYENWKKGKFNKFYSPEMDSICIGLILKSQIQKKILQKKLKSDRSSFITEMDFVELLGNDFKKKFLSPPFIQYISQELKGKFDIRNPYDTLPLLHSIFKSIYAQWCLWEFEFMDEVDEIMKFNQKELNSEILNEIKQNGIQIDWKEIFPSIEEILK